MIATTETATPLINTAGLAGVARVEEVSIDGKPAMKVVFVDGIEATVARAFLDKSSFDIWLPSDRPYMAASVMLKVDEVKVMAELNKLAKKAANPK